MKQRNTLQMFAAIILWVALATVVTGCGLLDNTTGATTDPSQVTDITWEWETLKVTTGFDSEAQRPIQETTTVPSPETYTLILRGDGTFEGMADCNGLSGTYSTENGGYAFELGPSTLVFCGDESLEAQYRDLLSRVVAGGPDGAGGFALETAAGSERMEFRNGGPTPQP